MAGSTVASVAAPPVDTQTDDVGHRPRPRWRDPGYLAALVAVVAVSLYAALANLATASLAADEPVYLRAGRRYVSGVHDVLTRRPDGRWRVVFSDNFEHPPLAKYLFGFAQALVGRPSISAGRAVASLCAVAAGFVLLVWLGRTVGRWCGLTAFVLVTLLPQHGLVPDTLARHAYLEPVAALFVVASVATAWGWFATRSALRQWTLAALTGVLVGLATSSKEIGFLGILGPVLLGLGLEARRGARVLLLRSAQALTAAALAVAVFLSLYLPIGSPATTIRYMIDYQQRQSACGHTVHVAGRYTAFPPWWANLWFAWHGLGAVLATTLALLAVAGVALRRDRLVAWLALALAGPLVFLCFVNRFALSYYWTVCAPLVAALAAVGSAELARAARRGRRAGRRAAPLVAATAVATAAAVIAVSAAQLVHGIATLRAEGVRAVALSEQRSGPVQPTLLVGVPLITLREYLPVRLLRTALPKHLDSLGYVAVGTDLAQRGVDRRLRAFVAVNLAEGRLLPVYRGDHETLYRTVGPLTRPTGREVPAAEPRPLGAGVARILHRC